MHEIFAFQILRISLIEAFPMAFIIGAFNLPSNQIAMVRSGLQRIICQTDRRILENTVSFCVIDAKVELADSQQTSQFLEKAMLNGALTR
jgi:hypothetical protein